MVQMGPISKIEFSMYFSQEFIDLGSTIFSAILNKAGTKLCTGKDVVLRASVCSAGVKLVVILVHLHPRAEYEWAAHLPIASCW
jgi:hypothetical protein